MSISVPIISEWNPKGLDRAIADFKSLEGAGAKAQFAIKKAAVPAAAALVAVGAGLVSATKAAVEDAAAQELLAGSLRNTTGATDSQIAAVEDFISKTSVAAAVADDELRPALDSLARGTGDITKAQDLLGIALDVSAGTGKDLGAVSDALSKAFNGQLGPLKKLDPALTKLIADGASTDEVMAALSETFEGQASKAANTAQGKFKSFGIQMGEAKESIGAAVLPLVDKMLPALTKLATFVQNNTGLIITIAAVIGTLAAAIIAANVALGIYNTIQAVTAILNGGLAASNGAVVASEVAVTAATTAATASFSALWVATGAVVILAIIAALVALQVKFDIFGKVIDGLKAGFNVFWSFIKTVFSWISDNWPLLLAIITGPFGLAIYAVVKFKDGIIGVLQGVKDFAVTIFDGIVGAFKGVLNGILAALEGGINFVIGGLNKALDGIDKAAGPFVNFGEIPKVKIPRLAEGGIVTSPTLAMIGEGGESEAVIPLSKLGNLGGGITINVSGALDPSAVANQIRQILTRDQARLGAISAL
jgi:hypothetical protein